MVQTWAVLALSLGYVGLLFAVAYYGDQRARRRAGRQIARPIVYSLSLAVYCTSWTYYGSVGLSASSGYNFLPVYIGPILLFLVCWPLLRRIVLLSKRHNITSIADFIAARHGKSQWLAAAVTVIAVIGIMPYTALQLKAVSTSFAVLTEHAHGPLSMLVNRPGAAAWTELGVSLLLATFAILFGTRRIEATEHHDGLILAIAFESIVKLLAFLCVGAFVTWGMFGGFGDLAARVGTTPALRHLFWSGADGPLWITITGLAFAAALCLPRQFHATIVENAGEGDLRRAAWLFPLYLVAINIFVVPIAIAGLSLFPAGSVNGDLYVIALPMAAGREWVALLAFIGGFSAATGMVIMSCVALSTMVSNALVMPIVLHGRRLGLAERENMGAVIVAIRRAAIVAVMLLGYGYCRVAGDGPGLAEIGLLSFAAIAQFAPALLGGMIWRSGNAKGAIAGVVVGFLLWAYCLMLPALARSGWDLRELVANGPFGIGFLRPDSLFGLNFDPLTNGTLWSLVANIACYVGVSRLFSIRVIERIQASAFVDLDPGQSPSFAPRAWRGPISVGELTGLVSRYLGADRAQRAFADIMARRGIAAAADAQADFELVRDAERMLASAIGAPSARLVLALALERRNLGLDAAMGLLDDASEAIQYNRELLQETLETVRQGISVFDRALRLVCWNRHFRDLLELPADLVRVGVPLPEIIQFFAARGEFGVGDPEEIAARQLDRFIGAGETVFENRRPDGRVVEIRTNPMIGGGYVTTYSDISEHVQFAAELAAANELLERRVGERTEELSAAKALAEEANLGKTRFLAAASHDLLQPLNAARLYVASLIDHQARIDVGALSGELARKIDSSLGSVEDLLGVLLDISRLDAGVLTPERRDMPLDELFRGLKVEFAPIAERKGLALTIVPSGLGVTSDRRLLHRILQNLLSNAIRYTASGKILMGARRAGDDVVIQVADTGVGIPADKRRLIFEEFQRFAPPGAEQGVGLGLSIVKRIGRLLDHPIDFRSEPGRGTIFSVRVPRGKPVLMAHAASDEPRVVSGLEGAAVLCIDNDPGVRDGMTALLDSWGCRPMAAATLADAFAALTRARTPPALLLVDYHLDDVFDGLGCIERLRALGYGGIPAIMITADRSDGLRARAVANGVAVLNKPVKPAALRALAMRLIATRAAAE